MRCNNCGWENAPGNQRCEKCNTLLQDSSGSENLKSTVREASAPGQYLDHGDDSVTCPSCGYPVSPAFRNCPQCGASLQINSQSPGSESPSPGARVHLGTVNPWMKPQNGFGTAFCTLKPIAWEGESVSYNPISYSGTQVMLNRANTDPNNQSITSKEQALLTNDGRAWYIEDKSALHSTYVRVSKKTRLKSGDVILLGNRLFEFKD